MCDEFYFPFNAVYCGDRRLIKLQQTLLPIKAWIPNIYPSIYLEIII